VRSLAFVAKPPNFLLSPNLCSDSGRGIPDIAAQATGFRIFNSSIEITVGGTSGSAPVGVSLGCPSSSAPLIANVQIVAGIISLLNDCLLSQGKAPLGFFNPWLYGRGLEGLNDVTIGSNPGCGTHGFPAVVGWDPVSTARAAYSISRLADSGIHR
jgi:tripeptidyl-peptidase-1